MSQSAIALRLAVPRDAHTIAVMSREHIEQGLPWKYDPARISAAIRRTSGRSPLRANRRSAPARSPACWAIEARFT